MGKLLVYLHVAVKQRAFQSLLGAGLSGVAITAVGRVADFERALQDAPDGVLTLPVVLAAQNLTPALRGKAHGSFEERYALVGTGAPPEPNHAPSTERTGLTPGWDMETDRKELSSGNGGPRAACRRRPCRSRC